jgi:pectinesterase
MKLKAVHISLFFLSVLFANAQQIDTSYTVYSSYIKYKKNFPEIEIVKPQTFENVLEKKEIVYKEVGQRKLHIDAFYNTNSEKKPAVILVHGGGWKSGNKSLMEPMAQVIASKGYACFTVEYRLSLEAIYPAGIFDIKQAIQFVKATASTFNVDTTKVAILGCSAGGQMAALIGTTNNISAFEDEESIYNESTAVQAIVDVDGVIAFIHPNSSEGTMASEWLGGNSSEIKETWIQASALTHTNKNTPPILFIGSKYPRFLAGNEEMRQLLNQYSIYNQIEILNESPHSFWLFHPWFHKTTAYIINFLNKTLKET